MGATTWALIVLGLVAGGFSGMLGIGGAIVLIPALSYLFGFSQARAQGTSIGAFLPPIGILAALQYYRAGSLDVRAAALIALGFLFGAFGGAWLVPRVPEEWLRRAFATVLAYVAVRMMFSDPAGKTAAEAPAAAGAGALWLAYAVRRALGKRPPAPPA